MFSSGYIWVNTDSIALIYKDNIRSNIVRYRLTADQSVHPEFQQEKQLRWNRRVGKQYRHSTNKLFQMYIKPWNVLILVKTK